MKIDYSLIGNRIKLRRKELNITQLELADMINLSYNHLSAIETGKERPSFELF